MKKKSLFMSDNEYVKVEEHLTSETPKKLAYVTIRIGDHLKLNVNKEYVKELSEMLDAIDKRWPES